MKKIYIEISDICGLKCSFCPAPKGIRGVMNLEFFRKAVAESTHHTNLITLHILGDPLCVENLEQYLAVAKNANLKVEITTSGANLANLGDFDLLLNAPIKQVNFSLDALNELENRDFLLARIIDFCKYKRQIQSEIFVNLRIQKRARNRDLVAFLEREFGDFGVKNLERYLCDSQGKKCESRVKLGKKIIIDFREVFAWNLKGLDCFGDKSPRNDKSFAEFTHGTCLALKTHIGILANGEIVPCCMDSQGILSLGNIKYTTLDLALKSKKAQEMLNGFRQNRIIEPFCKVCDYRKVFDSKPKFAEITL